MDKVRSAAVLVELVRQLRAHDSWCGETHIQKATYILQELCQVPLGFEFILYKHGPFSFDLREALTEMRSDGLLILEAQQPPYGPRFATTVAGEGHLARFGRTVDVAQPYVTFVAERFADRPVARLERLATAVYFTLDSEAVDSHESLSQRIVEIKPHISLDEAREAIEEADVLREAAPVYQEAV